YERLWPDVYMTLFLNGVTYRPSCYQCTYAQSKRLGDITIGDFWGLGRKTTFEGGDTTKGCSVIIVNTNKGKTLLTACSDKFTLFKREYAEAVAGNGQLRAPYPYTRYAKRFNELYPRYSFRRAALYSSALILMIGQVKLLVKKYAPQKVQQICLKFYKYFKRIWK
ncbi:MAG: Coenzyme F420 hydrogenase/dehydrogenase, beta subunit C-terminal domain, partial [Elusimicrobiaceae bacterium]|nr:Coenzyme F420 hydrogenase/dehydrogenase, beta subunit C-terminal domain [Elusimicrobiaceae bacterium]